jgi:5-methylcytosine-specific restriction endonuclease McrA
MTQRNTTTRDRHRKVIARTKPPCGICGEPIDYALHYLDPMAYTVDHIVPLGPKPTPERIAELDVLSNKQAAHRSCNRDKWHRTGEDEPAARTFVTARTW